MRDIRKVLADIVGEDFVSSNAEELYYYARDPGVNTPHEPDYVVAPKTTEQVQKIARLANKETIPVVPMGNGMALTGLVIPQRGGIVLDMKRMNKILEVNEMARSVIVEGGTSHGILMSYLKKNHPTLRHSVPDSPPASTIAGNVSLHGQGRLTGQYGFNSDMVTGLEVVLSSGEIVKIGSCCMSPYWFSKGPTLPDMSGLFLGWYGGTGIFTKVGLKLYPCKKIRELEVFVVEGPDLVPEIIHKVTHTEMVEDVNSWFQPKPLLFKGNHHVSIYFTGDTDEAIEFKRRMIYGAVKEFRDRKDGGFMMIFPAMKPIFMEMPQKGIAAFADVPKGGGFEYSGPICLIEKYPIFARKIQELAAKYDVLYAVAARVIGSGHAMMFGFSYAFNRADEDMMERVRGALKESAQFAFDQGGIPWKPTLKEQAMAMKLMDPNFLKLMKMVKDNLDPKGIMNPGNWEVK
ncbi:MAG: FAD-binding oxidoreductase [Pirellulales bacterium]|nr:FAD-binding oxidoreductase [Pirellulales bacterium]